ncbi:MAG TPA: outer membrane beta-barrel protein, partial [Pseudomonadales bacterium]|nr:outer membrane beta-barrel protein [Pseudomonadales bacterium]
MSRPAHWGICFTTLLLTPIATIAAPIEEASVGDKGAVRVLGVDVIPELKIAVANTDNLLKSDTDKISSTHTLVRPSATAHVEHGLSVMEAEIAAEENHFSNTGEWDYNYEAVDANFKGDFDLTPRNRVNLTAQYLLSQENPGEGFSQGTQVRSQNAVMLNGNTFPFERIDLHGGYEFGHREATGRIEVFGDAGQVKYSETRALPYNPDRKSNGFGGRFHLRMTAKTAFSFGAGQRTVRYDDYTPLDSDESYWELGASFTPSDIFVFDARAGENERTLVNDNDRKTRAPSYNVTATWSPLTYSHYTLGATQSFQ